MKKLSLALIIMAAFAASAQAQTNVTVYGQIDLGLAKTSGAASIANPNGDTLKERNNHTSRLGFKGSEDLGNGLSAVFQLESEIKADTGETGAGLFDRQANVGLAGGFGLVKLGRTKGLIDGAVDRADPFANDGVIGDNTTLIMRAGVSKSRVSNAITYNSPNFSGFKLNAQYALSEVSGADAGYQFLATYDNGPISLHAGYEKPAQAAVSTIKPHMYVIGGGYQFGPAKVTAAYVSGDPKTAASATTDGKNKGYLLGLNYTVGGGDAKIVYGKLKNDVKDMTKEFGLGYDYHLSKRTDLYAYIGREQVVGVNAYQVGMSHKF